MTAVPLFDVDAPRARKTDDRASHEAARRTAFIQGKLRAQILDVFGRYRSLTKDGVCERLGVEARRWPTVASALSQLKNAGVLEWTGEVVAGQNVWRLRATTVDVKDGLV